MKEKGPKTVKDMIRRLVHQRQSVGRLFSTKPMITQTFSNDPHFSSLVGEVRLFRWHVKVGDHVNKGQILCEYEWAKWVSSTHSNVKGKVLDIYVEEDEVAFHDKPIIALLPDE